MDLSDSVKSDFLDRGYIVLPAVVPQHLLRAAQLAIDARLAQDPPGPSVRGKRFL